MLGRHARPYRDLDPAQHPQGAERQSGGCDGRDAAGAGAGRFASMGRDALSMSDDDIRQRVAERERRFREEATTSAAQAATIILNGVKADQWRILVGPDAHRSRVPSALWSLRPIPRPPVP